MTYKGAAELLIKRVEEMRAAQEVAFKSGSERDMNLAKIHERTVDRICTHLRGKGYNPENVPATIRLDAKGNPF